MFLSERERAEMVKLAEAEGLSLSAWIRRACRQDAPGLLAEDIAEAEAAVGKLKALRARSRVENEVAVPEAGREREAERLRPVLDVEVPRREAVEPALAGESALERLREGLPSGVPTSPRPRLVMPGAAEIPLAVLEAPKVTVEMFDGKRFQYSDDEAWRFLEEQPDSLKDPKGVRAVLQARRARG